ncbi:MAG: XRE family transcriptional regulator [Cellulosilyticum sp.]|nr:XRE family transcriptional regulator [Cellulosilyticum sp.]
MQDKLNQLMTEYYVTFEELSVRLGVSKRTLTRKMKGDLDWTYPEISLLMQIFNIQDPITFFYEDKE